MTLCQSPRLSSSRSCKSRQLTAPGLTFISDRHQPANMAAAMMTPSGLCSMSLQSRPARQTTTVRSGFMGQRMAVALPRLAASSRNATRQAATMGTKDYPSNWIRTDPLVFVLGFAGWTIPTTLGVPIFNGGSFFGEFLGSIGRNLSRFPNGPPLNDPFWLYLTVYHAGLFLTLFLGQIGVQGRRQGYWN